MNWLKILVSFLSFMSSVVGYVLQNPSSFLVCRFLNYENCRETDIIFGFGVPIFNISLSFFIISVLFFFVSSRVFYRWLLVSIPYLALSAYVIYQAPISHHSVLLLDLTKLDISKLSAGIFFVVSLMYVAVSFWLERQKRRNPSV